MVQIPEASSLRGGTLYGPVINAGELYITAPTLFNYSNFTEAGNMVTNSGTLHCTATSAAAENSVRINAIVTLACTPASVLSLDIAGRPAQRDQWARIFEGGQAAIHYGGTLKVNFANFTPAGGDRWKVIDNSSSVANTGEFARIEFTNVPAGFTPVWQNLANGYVVGLDAAAAPVTYATWAAAQNFPTPSEAAFNADSDMDGMSNGVELALGTDPQSGASVPARRRAAAGHRWGGIFRHPVHPPRRSQARHGYPLGRGTQ